MGWKRTRRDAVAWRELLQRQAPSGLSQAAFCVAEGLSVSSLQNWKRKFVREGRFSEAPPTPAAPWFAELAVPEPGSESVPPTWQIELELGGGVVLRIHRTESC